MVTGFTYHGYINNNVRRESIKLNKTQLHDVALLMTRISHTQFR